MKAVFIFALVMLASMALVVTGAGMIFRGGYTDFLQTLFDMMLVLGVVYMAYGDKEI